MISGTVDARLDATIPLKVYSPTGLTQDITAAIDTGYNGALTLPSAVVVALSLPPLSSGGVVLADGTRRGLSFFQAHILWDGQMRTVRVLCMEANPLVGTALVRG